MGKGSLGRLAARRHVCALSVATALVGAGGGACLAEDMLADPAVTRAVTRCQGALAAAGRATAAATLGALGQCVARVVACDQKGGGRDACLQKAAPRCAKDLAKGDRRRTRAVAKAAHRCEAIDQATVLDPAGLGFSRLIVPCAQVGVALVGGEESVACVARRHACLAEQMLTLQYPRARDALAAAGIGVAPESCLGVVTTPVGFPVGKRGVSCTKAANRGGAAFVAKVLGGLGSCVSTALGCVERTPDDPRCLGKVAAKCARMEARAAKAAAKLVRGVEKRCDGIEFASLAAALGLADIAEECTTRQTDVDSLEGWGTCLARTHRCLAEDLLAQEAPRTAALLDALGRTLDPACAGDLAAAPGPDRTVVLGETVILVGGATGTAERPDLEWALAEVPNGSQVSLADLGAATQLIVPDVAGDYLLTLVAKAGGRTSAPAPVTIHALADAPEPAAVVSVAGMELTASRDGFADPHTDVLLQFEGPVDPTTLTTEHVILARDGMPIATTLAFDEPSAILTVTPDAPLPLDAFLRLRVDGVGATVAPADVIPFATTFFTPERELSIVEGAVLAPDRSPIPMVHVTVGGLETFTDERGRFAFADVPLGSQELAIDPSTVEGVVYAPLTFFVDVQPGVTANGLGHPIVLTVVDTATAIDYPAERVLTSPVFPGLVIDFSASNVRNIDGSPYVGPLSVSPVGARDVPMPFPGASESFWTIQPGGLLVDPPAVVTAPLPIAMDPGDEIDLWAFDHGTNQWVSYGTGIVEADGLTATSQPGAGLPFTGWHSVVTRREVVRPVGNAGAGPAPTPAAAPRAPGVPVAVEGTVVDGDLNPLHGVEVDASGGQIVYTDYAPFFDGFVDGSYRFLNVLVGYNVFVSGVFDHFEPRDPEICAVAETLLGDFFAACVIVDVSSLADPAQLDGALPLTVILPDPIVIEDDVVLDDQKHIQLHADMVSASRSHVIRAPHPEPAIESSSRYRAEVEAITAKLASLGFRQEDIPAGDQNADFLTQTAVFQADFAAQKAVKLFQTIWFEGGQGSRLWSRSGSVGERELRALNAIDGVLWTRNDPFEPLNGYRPQSSQLRNRMFHAGIPPKLTQLRGMTFSTGQPMRSTINSATRAVGGTRIGFNQNSRKGGHVAGSECDVAWVRKDGGPGSGLFYERLVTTIAGVSAGPTIHLSQREVPLPSEEWTEAEQQTMNMFDAWAIGRRWRYRPTYSTPLTQELIGAINSLRQDGDAPILFNDPATVCPTSGGVPDPNGPGCGDLSRYAGHSNHVHFGLWFHQNETLPAFTDGAPPFPRAAVAPGVVPAEGFTLVSIDPGHTPVPRDPAASIEVEFSDLVDPRTLSADTVTLAEHATGEAVPLSLRLDATGTRLTVTPGVPLPENAIVILQLSNAIRDATGRPLVLPDGDPTVASYRTTLSNDVIGARFEPDVLALTRDDLSAAVVRIVGDERDGGARIVTDFVDEFALVDPAGRGLEPAGGAERRLTRVFEGRATLQAFLSNGIEATALLDADLVGSVSVPRPVLMVGEPLEVVFGEAVDDHPLRLIEAEAIDPDGGRHPGTIAVGGATATFTADADLPRLAPLELELTLTVTDPAGTTIDVVTRVGFSVVGVRAEDPDTDGDGLPDVVEDALGTCVDAALPDTDGDGTADGDEDCDEDGLTNAEEVALGLNPGTRDTDGDGIFDPMELSLGCDPRVPETTTVVGRTVDASVAPVADVAVRALGRTSTSGGTGEFTIPGVPACPARTFRVAARRDGEPPLEAVSASVASMADGTTDVGNLVMEPVTAPLYPDGHFTGDADHVMLVDVDEDGVLDAVTANSGSDGISVLLGRGDGTFAPEMRFSTGGTSARSLDAAYLDADGHIDLVTCVAGGLSVLLGNGDGTFVGQFLDTSGEPRGVTAADMNDDGALDLVAASDGIGVVVLLGNGDGTFQPEQTFGSDRDQTDVVVGLFDDDAALDVVTSGRAFISSSIGEVVILRGNGDGTLQPEQEFRTETNRVHALLAADLDGDTKLDLIAASDRPLVQGGPFEGSVLRGNGDGTFQPAARFTIGTVSAGGRMALGQLTADDHLDLVSADGFLELSLLAGNGDGTFQPPVSIPRGLVPEGLAIGDLDGDGLDDIVNTDTFDLQLWSLLGNGDGTFRVAGQSRLEILFESGSGTARRYATADFNDDGHLDLVTAGHTRRLAMALGKGDFFFEPHIGLEAVPADRTSDVDVGDFDGNGTIDAVALARDQVVTFPGNGDGTFDPGIPTSLGGGSFDAEELQAAYLNDDDALDLVATLGFDDQVATLLGNGDGTFQPPTLLGGVLRPIGLAVADLENDGHLDLIVAPLQQTGLGIYRGNGDGTFAPVRTVGEHVYIQVAAADVNRDTIVDLVASGYPADGPIDAAAFVFLGNGDGTFQRELIYPADVCPEGMISLDVSGDDVPDIVTANCGADDLSLFLGNGDGTFQPQISIGVGQPDQLAAGDLDGDGAPDLIVGTEFVDVGILPHR
jgi:hypothetical protein